MNANHTRPLLAFWFLAAVAAVITALGLRSADSAVVVPAGTPAPVGTPGSPELVLGGALVANRAAPALSGSATQTVAWSSAAGRVYTGALAAAASTGAAQGSATPATAAPTVPTRTTTATRAPGPATASAPARGAGKAKGTTAARATAGSHGKGHAKSAKGKATAAGVHHRPRH